MSNVTYYIPVGFCKLQILEFKDGMKESISISYLPCNLPACHILLVPLQELEMQCNHSVTRTSARQYSRGEKLVARTQMQIEKYRQSNLQNGNELPEDNMQKSISTAAKQVTDCKRSSKMTEEAAPTKYVLAPFPFLSIIACF